MILAAGIMFVCHGQVLFLKRGLGSDHPEEWCFPGGQQEPGETLEECAVRETTEECGTCPDGVRMLHTRSIMDATSPTPTGPLDPTAGIIVPEQVDFTTFIQHVDDYFTPTLNDEHTGYAWADIATPPEPLHPGCRIALARINMDELSIAEAMRDGLLVSPQQYQNLWLFDIRITGTGLAYRSRQKEHVWRDSSIYLNDRFLARCNGLPVIWQHPDSAILNTKEYAERNIGSVFLPYIKGDEVWAIAKILDAGAAKELGNTLLSTSPAVVLRDVNKAKVTLDDGTALLIEGVPSLLDHIAICVQGVWDKGGAPAGVRTDNIGDLVMADSHEGPGRADGDAMAKLDAKLDKMLKFVDSVSTRMDAMETAMADKSRKDAEEAEAKKKKEEAKADAARKDASSKRDAEREEWMKEDAAMCAKDDADEAKKRDEYKEKGDPEDVAADKARKDRRDSMKARKDAAEEEAKKMDKSRKDSEEQAKRIADALAQLPKRVDDADYKVMADEQFRCDSVFQSFGRRASAPLQSESVFAYKVRLHRELQQHSQKWKAVDLAKLPPEALDIACEQIRVDALDASRPPDVPGGGVPDVRMTDPPTGQTRIEFRGRDTIFRRMSRPSARVRDLKTNAGRNS